MAIILHQNGRPIFVNLSAIETIQKLSDDSAVVYFSGGNCGLCIDESFEDIMTLIEIAEHG